jgi:hypothetical protein
MVKWYHMALLMLRSEFDSLCPDHIKTYLQPNGSEKSAGSVFQYGALADVVIAVA